MHPPASFHDHLDEQAHLAREREQEEIIRARYESEKKDRDFVRATLRDAVTEDEIERRLLLQTEFVRLNPGLDAQAYVRGIIDEEKSSFHALGTPVPPSLDEPPAPAKFEPESAPPMAQARPAAPNQAQSDELTATPLPRKPEPAVPALASRAEASEAAVRKYLNENFQPSDWLAVVLKNRKTGETIQRISTAQRIGSSEFQRWLRYENAHGSDIYVSLNTFQDHAHGRTKADLKEIRHLYLDLDKDGPHKMAAIRGDNAVPTPNHVLNTSPGKFQVIWKVEGSSQEEAEILPRALAERFGGDPAATDSTRVFRLPGFSNKKYEDDFQVTFTTEAPPSQVYRPADFNVQALPIEGKRTQTSSTGLRSFHEGDGNSQSEKDWAYAIRKLKEGQDPLQIIRDMARYRSVDRYDKNDPAKLVAPRKDNSRYYAERTVTQAMAYLGITRPAAPKPSAQPAPGPTDLEPSR